MERCLHLLAVRRWSGAVMVRATLLTLVALAMVLASAAVRATEVHEKVVLSGSHEDQQFIAGETVEVNAEVTDDIFVAGRDVVFEGASAENIIAAGFSLTIRATRAEDMILAAGNIDFTGEVSDDLVAAVCPICPLGGRLHLRRASRIGDDARLAGRELDIEAGIGGDLYAAGAEVTLSGEVAGDARIEAQRIVLAPGARIGGDLLYAGTSRPEVPEGAVVAGEVREMEPKLPKFGGTPGRWIWFAVMAGLGFVLALMLLGAVLQLALPGLLLRAAATARESPWSTLGRGLVVFLLTPAVAVLAMATVIGIPLGLVIVAAFVVLLALAFVAIAYCLGLYLRGLFGRKEGVVGWGSRTLWTALGILVLVIVGVIPFVGTIIGLLALIAGVGAVVRQLTQMSHLRGAEA